jgi:hypothetical protein
MAFRQAAAKREIEALTRLIEAYARIDKQARNLAAPLIAALEKNGELTVGQVSRLEYYKQLIADTTKALEDYRAYVGIEIGKQSTASIGAGLLESRKLIAASYGDQQILGVLKSLNPAAVETLLGFLQPAGPLYKRLDNLPKWTAQQMADAILEGVGLGRNPQAIAREITRTLGMGLTDSMRMMRTVQLYSYREASRANYVANSDVVRGWQWMAELDNDTCGSCIAQHGSVHPLEESLDDHHNGRCAMLPIVIGGKNPLDNSGQEWFEKLSPGEQNKILGTTKAEAWRGGKFEFSQLSTQKDDPVYGSMKTEAALKDLVKSE